MDRYPIQLSESGWISTIEPNPDPAEFHVLCRIGQCRILFLLQ